MPERCAYMFKSYFLKEKYKKLLLTSSVANGVNMILAVIDSFIAGNNFGENGIAAVTLVAPLYSVALCVGGMITEGGGLMYARAAGEHDKKRMDELFSESLILAAIAGVILLLLSFTCGDLYFRTYSDAPNALAYAKEYYSYYRVIFGIVPIQFYLSRIVFNDGDGKFCMISYFTRVCVSIIVSVTACRAIGIKGIGIGELAGILASFIPLFLHFAKKVYSHKLVFFLSKKDIPNILKYSVSDALNYLYGGIVTVTLNNVILANFGESYLCIYALVGNLLNVEHFIDGIGGAMYPMIETFMGEKNLAAQKKVLKYSAEAVYLEGAICAAVIGIFAPSIVKLLGVEDPHIVPLCISAVRIVGIPIIGYALGIYISSYYILCERIVLATVLTCLSNAILPVVLCSIAGSRLGINGLWYIIGLSPLFSVILVEVFVLIRYGKKQFPYIYPDYGNVSKSYEFTLTEENAVSFRDDVEKVLIENNVEKKRRFKLLLLCEEIPLLIHEKNDKRLLMECSLLIGEKVNLIFRDDGESFDLTDEDMDITSLRSYILSRIMSFSRENVSMLTTSYNRNIIYTLDE